MASSAGQAATYPQKIRTIVANAEKCAGLRDVFSKHDLSDYEGQAQQWTQGQGANKIEDLLEIDDLENKFTEALDLEPMHRKRFIWNALPDLTRSNVANYSAGSLIQKFATATQALLKRSNAANDAADSLIKKIATATQSLDTAEVIAQFPEALICLGNPGAGKSTLLNSMLGDTVFKSGFTIGTGLTLTCNKVVRGGVIYIDTPGLADVAARPRAAQAIEEALNANALCKIIFVITLEAGHLRPEDEATIELIKESLPEKAKTSFVVVVNKASKQDVVKLQQDGLKDALHEEKFPRNHLFWVPENIAIEDKSQQLLKLSEEFQNFQAEAPTVYLAQGDVAPIQHDKFEQIIRQHEKRIQDLISERESLQEKLGELLEDEPKDGRVQEKGGQSTTQSESVREFKVGDHVVLVDSVQLRRFRMSIEKDVLHAGRGGEIVSVSSSTIGVKFAHYDNMVDVERSKLCNLSEVPTRKRQKVCELAYRGIEVEAILNFYNRLGKDLMPDFRPGQSTTWNVVNKAIIPETKAEGLAYATTVKKPILTERMVSHTWSNLFIKTVAAVVADALDLPIYEEVMKRLENGDVEGLRKELTEYGTANLAYWLCPFSVNQHRSICKHPAHGCACTTTLHPNGSPDCEMDQFDEMMLFIFDRIHEHERARHVIAVDPEGKIFSRAWVNAELVATLMSLPSIDQHFVAFDKKSLHAVRSEAEGGAVDIRKCESSNPDDAKLIVEKAHKLIEAKHLTWDSFHRRLNDRIFDALGETEQRVQKIEQLHILCIGNVGVGKTTLVKLLTGNAVQLGELHQPGILQESQASSGTVYLETPGLADTRSRKKAADIINQALMRGGQYKLFFVVTLESGRVRPSDIETIELVRKAARIGSDFTVLVNKASREISLALEEGGSSRMQLLDALPGPPNKVKVMERAIEGNMPKLPEGLESDAPRIQIKSGKVGTVDGETLDDKAHTLEKNVDRMEHDNANLRERLKELQGIKRAKILILGLDNAGKTTLVDFLKNDRIATLTPTLHPHSEEVMINDILFRFYDLGGHEALRHIWKDYFATVDGIIFMVDAADRTRFNEAKEELNGLLEEQSLSSVKFVILGNKIDIPTAASEDELRNALGLYSHITYGKDASKGQVDVRPIELFMISPAKRMGYAEALQWLSTFFK